MDCGETESPTIDLCADIGRFFEELIDGVRSRHDYDATELATRYVASLLAGFTSPDPRLEIAEEQPLTLILADALALDGMARFAKLRAIGDEALYLMGFYGEQFQRRGVPDGYVQTLGAQAYQGAGAALRGRAGAGSATPGERSLFDELAAHFAMFVSLIRDVADALFVGTIRDAPRMLEAYQRWLHRDSPELSRALTGCGWTPIRGDETLH